MRLRTRIIISVILVSTIVNLSLCFYFTNRLRNTSLTNLDEQINSSIHMLKLVNAIPVFNVDRESIETNMKTFFADANMKSIAFQEYDIDIKFERTFDFLRGREINKTFSIFYKNIELGKMNVVYSTRRIEEKIEKLRNQIIFINFLGIFLLGFILILIVNRLMEPVNKLSKDASEIAAGNLDRVIETNIAGDVGVLARNFSTMRDAIKDKINALARANKSLENEIHLKEINERKIIKQSLTISSVNDFFKQTMLTATREGIVRIFISIIKEVIPSKYCFVCEVQKDKENFTELLAISDEALKDLNITQTELAALSRPKETSGIRLRAFREQNTIIENNPIPHLDFVNFPENNLSIDELMVIPLKWGQQVMGLIVLAGKSEQYDLNDRNSGEMLATALMESLLRKSKEIEKKQLEDMMIHSEKMVSLGGLAAGMAHEINNPLAGVLQNAQVILSRLQDELPANIDAAKEMGFEFDYLKRYMDKRSIYKLLGHIQDAGKRAADIVGNMLSFSQKNVSGFMIEDISVLLDKTLILAESDYNLKKKFDFKAIKIIKEYASDVPQVRCKASELQQVFFNLLSNGAQAMSLLTKGHSPCFNLKVFSQDDKVKVEIRDNGPGMKEEIQKRVFEPFFTTKAVGEGTGLGLSVSYFIITENHKGTIEVESKPGQGCSFLLSLPIDSKISNSK